MAKNNRRDHLLRYIGLGVIVVAVSLVFIARLINIQVASKDYYVANVNDNTYSRTVKIQAQRGTIYDSDGHALVSNSYSYDVYFDAGDIPKGVEKNDVVINVIDTAKRIGEFDKAFTEPDHPFVKSGDKWTLDEDYMQTVFGRRLNTLLIDMGYVPDKNENKDDESVHWEGTDISDMRNSLLLRYGIIDKEGAYQYYLDDEDTEGKCLLLFKVRLDMEMHNFSVSEPYTVLTDVSVKLITAMKEGSVHGIGINCRAERQFNYPGVASHILGRTGKITAETADYYTEQGYTLDAIVGTSGAEAAFETYLHGEDGELTIVEDEYGHVVDQYVSVEPKAGKDVYLTINVDFQKAAEKALADNIAYIVDQGQYKIWWEKENHDKKVSLVGEDANAGALTVLNPKDGSVLALATYPTYNLVTFNEDYEKLTKDKASPLFFRALDGTYAPGSTFKPGIAVAALTEGIITPETEIEDEGEYQYYADVGLHPRCWIYSEAYGWGKHGLINVSEAIQVSCNCFFYDVGRQLTITKMNKYCSGYGLGQPTGIELNEKVGILAGPEEREATGGAWYDGNTIMAAIGQDDNLFTPLQLSVYISTILNNGQRYKAHILKEVREYDGTVVYTTSPQVISKIKLSDEACTTVKNAMKDATENGSAARVFADYPIEIGGKTGTAQVSTTSSDNAAFVAFAPFDNPEIVATCIIEHGAAGTDTGFAIKDVFSYYFKLGG